MVGNPIFLRDYYYSKSTLVELCLLMRMVPGSIVCQICAEQGPLFSYLLFLFFSRQHSTATTVNIMDLCDNNDEDKCKFCDKGPFKSIRGHHRHSPSCGQQDMIQSQIQASQTSSTVATSPRDGRHHSQDPLAKFLKQSPAAIDFVQTVCFDADDYDNGLFLDSSLVDSTGTCSR